MGLREVRNNKTIGGKEQKATDGKEPLPPDRIEGSYNISLDTLKLLIIKRDREKIRKAAEKADDREVRIAAIEGILKTENEGSVLFLEELARMDSDEDVKNAALMAVRKISGKGHMEMKADSDFSIEEIDDFDTALERISDVDDEWPEIEMDEPAEGIEISDIESIELFGEGDISQSDKVVKIVLGNGDISIRELAVDAIMNSGNVQAADLVRLCFGMKPDEDLGREEIALKQKIQGSARHDAKYDSEVAELTQTALGSGSVDEKRKALNGLIESEHPDAFEMIDLYLTSQDEKELSEDELKLKKEILEKLKNISKFLEAYRYLLGNSEDSEIKGIILGKFREHELNEFTMKDLLNFLESDGSIEQKEKILRYLANERADAPAETYKKLLHGKKLEDKEESRIRSMVIDNLSYYYGTYDILAVLKEASESDCDENNRKRAGQLIEFLEATR